MWAAIYAFASYAVGNSLSNVSGKVNIALGAAAAVAIVTTILVVRRQAGRLGKIAEAAYPGSLDSPE